ncbi:MAG: hypothetical protein QF632_00570 [Candidatus Woesearchaeota archaeon]|jgi:dihydrodipicolinate synthase/N-acetylneuraminate lyase|nr:hypothetical protein [Candidatus Woesearchaeota archaeon]MDP7323233.1 hypothetical protein [Candidatus Woesearchaeota archaeon]MDP7457088.1 hypothetical protein [Candidatus Woesearchaeota archaeon]
MFYEPPQGVIVPVLNCFRDGKYNHEAQNERYLNMALDGIRTFFVNSLTSETGDMDKGMRRDIIRSSMKNLNTICYFSDPPLNVMIGVHGDTIDETRANAQVVEDTDVEKDLVDFVILQAAMIQDLKTSAQLDQLVREVTEITGKPLFFYVNSWMGRNPEIITPEYLRDVCQGPHVRGAKVSAPYETFQGYAAIELPHDSALYAGNALDIPRAMKDETLVTKPKGVVTGPANVDPTTWLQLWEGLSQEKNTDDLEIKIIRQNEFLMRNGPDKLIAVMKFILEQQEKISDPLCLNPESNLTPDAIEILKYHYTKERDDLGPECNTMQELFFTS